VTTACDKCGGHVEITRCDHNNIVDGGNGAVYLLPVNRSLFPNPGDIHELLTALHYFSSLLFITVRHTDCLQP
jgi:hypothetical protein